MYTIDEDGQIRRPDGSYCALCRCSDSEDIVEELNGLLDLLAPFAREYEEWQYGSGIDETKLYIFAQGDSVTTVARFNLGDLRAAWEACRAD
jgi:hypothetical protein